MSDLERFCPHLDMGLERREARQSGLNYFEKLIRIGRSEAAREVGLRAGMIDSVLLTNKTDPEVWDLRATMRGVFTS